MAVQGLLRPQLCEVFSSKDQEIETSIVDENEIGFASILSLYHSPLDPTIKY